MASYSVRQRQILRAFGGRVRRGRLSRGWTQEHLALAAGLDRSYVGGVERGERNLTLFVLLRLITALGSEPRALLPIELLADDPSVDTTPFRPDRSPE